MAQGQIQLKRKNGFKSKHKLGTYGQQHWKLSYIQHTTVHLLNPALRVSLWLVWRTADLAEQWFRERRTGAAHCLCLLCSFYQPPRPPPHTRLLISSSTGSSTNCTSARCKTLRCNSMSGCVPGISQSRISHWLLQHGSDLSEQKKRAFYRWYTLEKTTPGKPHTHTHTLSVRYMSVADWRLCLKWMQILEKEKEISRRRQTLSDGCKYSRSNAAIKVTLWTRPTFRSVKYLFVLKQSVKF